MARPVQLQRGVVHGSMPQQVSAVVQQRASVIAHFKNADNERLQQLAQMPEQPVTVKYPPPAADLADILPNPGVCVSMTADAQMWQALDNSMRTLASGWPLAGQRGAAESLLLSTAYNCIPTSNVSTSIPLA